MLEQSTSFLPIELGKTITCANIGMQFYLPINIWYDRIQWYPNEDTWHVYNTSLILRSPNESCLYLGELLFAAILHYYSYGYIDPRKYRHGTIILPLSSTHIEVFRTEFHREKEIILCKNILKLINSSVSWDFIRTIMISAVEK